MPTDTIIELNDLTNAETKLVCDKTGLPACSKQ